MASWSGRLPGNPTVLVACHPTKNATDDNMLPRGGGSFLNEVDGNLACIKKGDLTVISQHGKYRDVYFPPIPFLRSVKYCERLKTKSGKLMPTVVAHLATEQEAAEHGFQVRTEDMQVLELLNKDAAMSLRDIASKSLWITKDNNIDATKVKRVIDRLRKAKLIGEDNQLTGLGEKKLNEHQQSSLKPAGSGGNGAEHNIVRGLFEARQCYSVVWVSAGIFLKSYPRAPIHLDLNCLVSNCYREERKKKVISHFSRENLRDRVCHAP
jgi:hypothetical protein